MNRSVVGPIRLRICRIMILTCLRFLRRILRVLMKLLLVGFRMRRRRLVETGLRRVGGGLICADLVAS